MAGGGGAGGAGRGAGGSPLSLRKGEARMRTLRAIVRDTQKALADVADIITVDPELSASVHEIGARAGRAVSVLVLGRSCAARARLVNCLLGLPVLPVLPASPASPASSERPARGWKWVRFQFGNTKQVHSTLGNSEFELVDELECNKAPWDTLPLKDLQRADDTDLSTILDVELNNPFLKGGPKIIIPPDLDHEPPPNLTVDQLKELYSDFYAKRLSILKHFNGIYFYSIDAIGKIGWDKICDVNESTTKYESCRTDDDLWKTYNMYYMTRVPSSCDNSEKSLQRLSGEQTDESNRLEVGVEVGENNCRSNANYTLHCPSYSRNIFDLNNMYESEATSMKRIYDNGNTMDCDTSEGSCDNEADASSSNALGKESKEIKSEQANSFKLEAHCDSNMNNKLNNAVDLNDNPNSLEIEFRDKRKLLAKEQEPSSTEQIYNDEVFSNENCVDILQAKEVSSACQVYFVLLADSQELRPERREQQEQHEQHGRLEQHEQQEQHERQEEWTESAKYEALPESDRLVAAPAPATRLHYTASEARVTHEASSRGGAGDAGDAGDASDARQLFNEQWAFMSDLLDQWDIVGSSSLKSNVKSHWMILDDAAVMRTNPYLPAQLAAMLDVRARAAPCERDRSDFVDARAALVGKALAYCGDVVKNFCLDYSTRLSEIHIKLLQQFILASFDLARELQVVPKKIEYVARQEQQLYDTITEKFSEGEKKEELVRIMVEALREAREDVDTMDWCVDEHPCPQERNLSSSAFYPRRDPTREPPAPASRDVEQAYDSYNFADYDVITQEEVRRSVSVHPTLESYRSQAMNSQYDSSRLESESMSVASSIARFGARMLEPGCACGGACPGPRLSVKQASLDVQRATLTRLSARISTRLVHFVDCLRETYFGTLQRCLEGLEESCRLELGGRPASEAVRQVVCAARQLELTSCASFSVLRTLLEHLRRLMHRLRLGGTGPAGSGAGACCVLSPAWRRHVAAHTLATLSPHRLARHISAQIRARVQAAHERYQAALGALQAALQGRLEHSADARLALRRRHAPRLARYCLESTSLCDLLLYGAPELGREIGRGQYGVVFSCRRAWAGHEPCAVKSVLPADERHFNELAMEFFYTRSIPHHERIVRLYGSVVERHPSGSPTVLLVSQRLARDLYCAVRAATLALSTRLRIALDIVEGIRYLHSLGLIHRDIKMKNVLLDGSDRARLTDLGFCVPEALMSGSVVGTPVHMAPELLTGDYTSSVDVYAFGILFWYLCAGSVKLPAAFEAFQNKEQLWSKVRRGLRPERLPQFSAACWRVMEACWAPEPAARALLGHVQPQLEDILAAALAQEAATTPGASTPASSPCAGASTPDHEHSLQFTGFSMYDVV